MKKFLGLMCMLLFVVALTACGTKDELKPFAVKGGEMSEDEIEVVVEDWEKYEEEKSEEEELYDGWYSVKYEMVSNYETDEDDAERNIYMKLSGKVYQSYYKFDNKFKLNMEINYETDEHNVETKVTGDIDFTYVEGSLYMKVDLKSTVKSKYSKETTKIKEYISGSLGDMDDLDLPFDFDSSYSSIVHSFLGSLKYMDSDTMIFKNGNTYYAQSENETQNDSSVNIAKIKFNDKYELKEVKMYSSSVSISDEEEFSNYLSYSIKSSLGSLIIKPFNSDKYFAADLSDILERLQ